MKSMMQLTRADLDKFQIAQDAPYCGVDCRGQDREAPYALYVLGARMRLKNVLPSSAMARSRWLSKSSVPTTSPTTVSGGR